MKKKILAIFACFLMAGCSYDADFRAYVMTDRLNYNADVVLSTTLIDKADNISVEDKETFKARLKAKDEAITEAEKLLGIKK
jgi:uncharacterized protein YcfL